MNAIQRMCWAPSNNSTDLIRPENSTSLATYTKIYLNHIIQIVTNKLEWRFCLALFHEVKKN